MIKIELTKEKCRFCEELFKEKQLIMSFKTAYIDGTDELYHVHTECVEQAMAGYRQKQAQEWTDKHAGYPPGLQASESDIRLFRKTESILYEAIETIRHQHFKLHGNTTSNLLENLNTGLVELQSRIKKEKE